MKKALKSIKGFTLVELMVVIIIIGILAGISIPIYNGYVKQAIVSEGKGVAGAVAAAEKVYYQQKGVILQVTDAGMTLPDPLGIDCTQNKYFQEYSTTPNGGAAFTVSTWYIPGAGGTTIQVDLDQPANGPPTWNVQGT